MTATQTQTQAGGEKLLGRSAFVTGGTRGIGAAICRSLASQGADVAAGYSGNTEAAERFQKEFEQDFPGRKLTVHKGDISSADDCRRTVAEVIEQHGRLDILVNNAGITADRTVRKMSPDDWDRVIQVNLSGTFYMSHLVYQQMLAREQGGRIISISSVIGERGNAGQANYAAAKSGLFGLTMSLATEGARKGITANCVAPGYIETDMVAGVPQKVLDKITAGIPLQRLGRPDEVARVVEFLADPESGYITGQVYAVNGGLYM